MANLARANLKHVRERELTRRNRTRRPASFKVGDLVLVHHSRLPTWPRNCLQDPYFWPYRILKKDGSRIHVRCSHRLGGELPCAFKQLRHYPLPDELSRDEWRLSDREVERIDLENAANPEEAGKLEGMTADEMPVDGYYLDAGIARHDYKQGCKFLTLWDGYGLSEATWEPMSAFIQPDRSINPISRILRSSSGGTTLGGPGFSNHCSTKMLTACSPVIFLLHGNARVKGVRPQVTTKQLSSPPNVGRPSMKSTYNRELAQQVMGGLETSPRSRELPCLLA